MKKVIQIFAVVGMLLLTSHSLKASHLLGGEITWECTANDKYIFTLVVYRECGSVPYPPATIGATQQLAGPNGSITVNRISVIEVSPVCLGGGSISCTGSQSGEGAVEKHTFKSGIVTLNGVPPAGGWVFSWTQSARPGTVVNITPGNYFLRAIMYAYTPIGATVPNNANPCYDNSPKFQELGSLTVCTGSPFTYNHLVADKDLDSLFVRFAQPWQGANTPVPWNTGYNFQSPYPSNLTNAANGPITLDGKTGEINMDIQVATPGSYASCYEVEAWKCGVDGNGNINPVKVASVFRDVVIITKNNCPVNNEPTAVIDTSVYKSIRQTGPKSYRTKVYPGDTVNFVLNAQDWDINPSTFLPQYILFEAAGLQVSNPLASGTGCDGIVPCAQFTPVGTQAGYNVTLNNNIEFFWVPDCQHLKVEGNYCNPVNTFLFSLRMQDDGCPAPEIALTTVIVDVIPGDPSPLNFTCLNVEDGTDDRLLGWDRAEIDSALEFNYYVLLAGPNSTGGFDTIQKIYDIDSVSTVVAGNSGYNQFYIMKSTGKCDFLSQPSDTLTVIDLNLNVITTPSGDYADLNWTNLSSPLPMTSNGVYEIWMEAPAGSANWYLVGQTTGNSFMDTVEVCDLQVNYQVRVNDSTVTFCNSGSNLVSGRFEDKSNHDVIQLDSVSVQNGQAIMSWSPTQYGDVVDYYIYFNDPKLGWKEIDTVPVGTPMPHVWTDSEADTRIEEFKVVSVDSCGNFSDNQLVRPHSTIYLRNYLNKCEAYSRLSWNTYEGFGRQGVAEYRIWYQEIINGTPQGWGILGTRNGDDTVYTQTNLQNGYEYCYRIQAVDTSGTRSSTSNEVCLLAEVPAKSQILYITQVTNNVDRNTIEMNTYIDAQADVLHFDIERALTPEGPFERIATIPKPAMSNMFSFFDYGANPKANIYYYRVSATDSCGGRDTVTGLSNNVLLDVQARGDVSNMLTWNHYKEWAGDVARYDVYRQADEETRYSLVAQVSGADSSYQDNFDKAVYGNGRGNFCYYVVAVEGANLLGIVQPNGDPYDSRSNTVCMNQKAKVFIPTAFNPNSEQEINRSFGPSMKFVEVSEYSFYIMNRWGVKVFETTNPEERWDGTYDGQDAAQGVYIYFVTYATPGQAATEERGSFTLIR